MMHRKQSFALFHPAELLFEYHSQDWVSFSQSKYKNLVKAANNKTAPESMTYKEDLHRVK